MIDRATLLAIIGMAVVSYLTRYSGVWLRRRFAPSPFFATCLQHAPEAVLAAIVAPTVVSGGGPTVGAAVATGIVAMRTRNLLLAISVGVFVVWLLRQGL